MPHELDMQRTCLIGLSDRRSQPQEAGIIAHGIHAHIHSGRISEFKLKEYVV